MTTPTSDGGTTFKTLPGECPWKVRAVQVADLQEDVLRHPVMVPGRRDHRLTMTPNNNDAGPTHAAPLNNTSAEAAAKKRFP